MSYSICLSSLIDIEVQFTKMNFWRTYLLSYNVSDVHDSDTNISWYDYRISVFHIYVTHFCTKFCTHLLSYNVSDVHDSDTNISWYDYRISVFHIYVTHFCNKYCTMTNTNTKYHFFKQAFLSLYCALYKLTERSRSIETKLATSFELWQEIFHDKKDYKHDLGNFTYPALVYPL
jgi:hypothetical protein